MNSNYLESDNIVEERVELGGIPCLIFRPKNLEGKCPSLILYHGWSSSKEYQRMRGFILASVGFQVLIPDAINHGEREPFDLYSLEVAKDQFWKTIKTNIEESDLLLTGLKEEYEADPERIGIIGNSMGGFTAIGVFSQDESLNSLVVLNGSGDWGRSNSLFSRNLFSYESLEDLDDGASLLNMDRDLIEMDPVKNLDRLVDRPILLLHGKADSLVPIGGQDSFYEKAKMAYRDSNRLKFIRYRNLNHFVTTNMMEESIIWFKKYMKMDKK